MDTESVNGSDQGINTRGLCHFLYWASLVAAGADVWERWADMWERQTDINDLVSWNPFWVAPGITQFRPLPDPSSSASPRFTCLLLCASWHSGPTFIPQSPWPHLWSLTHCARPFILVLHLPCDPDVLNPYCCARFCRKAEIWAADISLFPRSHQGLAHWPADKYFPNWWLTAAGISGPAHLFAGIRWPHAWELALFPHLFFKGLEIIFKYIIELFSR